MDRRRVWLVIIGILAAGFFITKLTLEFVTSKGVDASVITGMVEETQSPPFSKSRMDMRGAVPAPASENAAPGMAKQAAAEAAIEAAPAQEEPVMETAAESVKDEAAVGEKAPSYTSEELRARLDTAKEQAESYRLAGKSPISGYAEAEYEWNVWDKELNLIYSCIRSRMTKEEAEALKLAEMEWLKERDLAADKASVKNNLAPGQNEQYLRTLAKKTRERCYELLETYESVIDGE